MTISSNNIPRILISTTDDDGDSEEDGDDLRCGYLQNIHVQRPARETQRTND